MFGASSELASVMEFGFKQLRRHAFANDSLVYGFCCLPKSTVFLLLLLLLHPFNGLFPGQPG